MNGFSFLRPPRAALLRCASADPAGAVCGCGVVHAAPARIGRRTVLGALAAGTVLGSLPSPLRAAVPAGPLERPDVTIGFVPISCAAPLIMAEAQGFFVQEGLRVQLQKTANWALVRDRLLDGHLDASHLLSPMPLALSLGLGGNAPHAVRVASMQNLNGQAITLALRHHDRRDPRQWKGMTFAIPFEFSMHNLLLRAYLARHGLDPDHDVTLRVTAPPDMVANLRAGNIDGFLGPEPFNQRAVIEEVGFVHILTAEIWDGHPCCAFGMTAAFMDANPNTAAALQRAMIRAADFMQQPDNRAQAARIMAQPRYLNQPELVIRQSLTGHYADGLGVVRDNPRRAAYSPYPYPSMAVWIMSQLERWGYLKGPVDYRDVARQVFLIDAVRQQAQAMNLPQPADGGDNWPSFTIMGQHFDPDHPSFFNQG